MGGCYEERLRLEKIIYKEAFASFDLFYPLGGIAVFLYRKNLTGRAVLHRPFLWTLSLFVALWGFFLAAPTFNESPIQKIDREIEILEEMKRGYIAKALRHEDYAQRLQFEDRAYLEARRHTELAEENRAKAAKIQIEIDELQEKRKILLQKQGQGHARDS